MGTFRQIIKVYTVDLKQTLEVYRVFIIIIGRLLEG